MLVHRSNGVLQKDKTNKKSIAFTVMNVHRSNGVLLGDKSNKRFISFPGQA
jgi:hypothetical protein